MPSIVLGNPLASGPQIIWSGGPTSWSGRGPNTPIGGIQFKLSRTASGNVYIGVSGNITMTSGGMLLSGGGLNDGMEVGPGEPYFIPRMWFPVSGQMTVWAWHDVTCSGQARLYWQEM